MNTEGKIKEFVSKLYPTGRAWNFIRDNETQELVIAFTDGVDDPFTDGVGEQFVLATGSKNSFGKKIFIAESKSYARFFENAISVLNIILADNENFDSTDASNWERVLGLFTSTLTLEERKTAIARKQNYPNGIFERAYYIFIQNQLQAAGFNVYVHENRFADGSGGWDVVDPDDLAGEDYQMGFGQFGEAEFGGTSDGFDYTIAANHLDETKDGTFFDVSANQVQFGTGEFGVGEFQTGENLTREVELRFSFYICGSSFPSIANVPLERKKEFRQLVLSLKPLQNVVFLLINYI